MEQVKIHHFQEVLSFPSALGELHEVCGCFISDRIWHKETEEQGIPRKVSLNQTDFQEKTEKASSFTSAAAAEGRFRSTLSIYCTFSRSFSWSTTTHSQFAPCQQQPGATAQNLGTGWVKHCQSNTDPWKSSTLQVTLVSRL